MYALYSFAQVANSQLGPEQLSALYLSAGISKIFYLLIYNSNLFYFLFILGAFSSFTSLAHKVLIGIPSLSIGAVSLIFS